MRSANEPSKTAMTGAISNPIGWRRKKTTTQTISFSFDNHKHQHPLSIKIL
jgi:hypothetical protein